MLSPFKKTGIAFIYTLCVILSACGFRPMYGEHSALASNNPLAGNLIIDPINTREGQIFRIALEDKLNPQGLKTAQPQFRLQASLLKNLIPAVIKSDGTIQRYDIMFVSSFKLVNIADGKVLLEGNVTRTGSYNTAINANFATYEAEQDIIDRTLKEVAEDYVLRLSGYFASKQ